MKYMSFSDIKHVLVQTESIMKPSELLPSLVDCNIGMELQLPLAVRIVYVYSPQYCLQEILKLKK